MASISSAGKMWKAIGDDLDNVNLPRIRAPRGVWNTVDDTIGKVEGIGKLHPNFANG